MRYKIEYNSKFDKKLYLTQNQKILTFRAFGPFVFVFFFPVLFKCFRIQDNPSLFQTYRQNKTCEYKIIIIKSRIMIIKIRCLNLSILDATDKLLVLCIGVYYIGHESKIVPLYVLSCSFDFRTTYFNFNTSR